MTHRNHPLENCVARIFLDKHASQSVACGTGVALPGARVLTCAHVVRSALGLSQDVMDKPEQVIALDFPLSGSSEIVNAHIGYWDPDADIAELKLMGTFPAGVEPAAVALENGLWGHHIQAFGFPSNYPAGTWADGTLRGPNALGWIEIVDSQLTGYYVQQGFSGSPVWDADLKQCIGIIVAADKSMELRTSYLIPGFKIAERWKELPIARAELVSEPQAPAIIPVVHEEIGNTEPDIPPAERKFRDLADRLDALLYAFRSAPEKHEPEIPTVSGDLRTTQGTGMAPVTLDPPDPKSMVTFLQGIQPFMGLEEPELYKIIERMHVSYYSSGQEVFRVGETAGKMYFIYAGTVRLVRKSVLQESEFRLLEPGDCFGEQAVFTSEKRDRTAIAETDLILFGLMGQDIQDLRLEVPGWLSRFSLLVNSQPLVHASKFKWLTPNEVIQFMTRKHVSVLIRNLVGPLLAAFLSIVLFYRLDLSRFAISILVLLYLWLFLITWLAAKITEWSSAFYIVTNQRVVWFEKVFGIYDSKEIIPLPAITDVHVKSNRQERNAGYGNVVVESPVGSLSLSQIAYPEHVAQLIQNCVKYSKLRPPQTLGTKLQAPSAHAATPSEQEKNSMQFADVFMEYALSRLGISMDAWKLRVQESNGILYRKHWFVILDNNDPPFTLLSLVLLLLISQPYLFGGYLPWFTFIAIMLVIVDVVWWLYIGIREWSGMYYQITDDEILAVQKTTSGEERRESIAVKDISAAEYSRNGVAGWLFNFGSVKAAIGDRAFRIQDVIDPAGVHQEINTRRMKIIEKTQQK